MSTKPTYAPAWATDATFAAGADAWSGQPNKAEADAATIASGFEPSIKPAAEEMNWLLYYFCLWCQWLLDGDVTFDTLIATTIEGTTSVTTPLVIATTSVTTPVVYHTAGIERKIPVSMCLRGSGAAQLNTSGGVIPVGTNTERFIYPVNICEGETLTAWSVYINDTSGGTPATARLYKMSANTQVETPIGSLKTSGQMTYEQLANTGLSIPTVNAESYYIVVTPGGSSGLNLYHATYTVTKG